MCSPVPADVEARSWYWNVFVKHFFILVLSLSLHKTSPFQLNWLVREPQAPAVSKYLGYRHTPPHPEFVHGTQESQLWSLCCMQQAFYLLSHTLKPFKFQVYKSEGEAKLIPSLYMNPLCPGPAPSKAQPFQN